MVSYYSKEKAIPMIIELLAKQGEIITENNIKVWDESSMLLSNVKKGCDYIKRESLTHILVYTNKVPHKEYMEVNEGIKIYEQKDLCELALKEHNLELYDLLS